MNFAVAAGFSFVRTDLTWSVIETERGVFNFSAVDGMIHALMKRGVQLLLTVNYANKLYDGGEAPHTSAGRAAFTRYFLAAVAHYRGNGILWEIWNVRLDRCF